METTYSDWVSVTGTTNPLPLADEPRDLAIKETTFNSQKIGWKISEQGTETGYEVRKKKIGQSDFDTPIIVQGYEHTFLELEPETSYIYEVRSVKKQ